jgi:hypothetical protein
VQCQDLAAFELGLEGEEVLEEVRGQDAEGGFEVVEDELGVVAWIVMLAHVFCGMWE